MMNQSKNNPCAVQFGAGSIGRGFLGQLLFEGDCRTTFVDADATLVASLDARRSYPLRLVSATGAQEMTVGNLRALLASQLDAIVEAILDADVISTAVGVAALPRVAPVLAAGLSARAETGRGPVNVLLCENQWHAADLMRDLLRPHLASETRAYLDTEVGLVETVIGRMVPAPTSAVRAEDPLLVVAEPYKELPVNRAALRGPLPRLPGLILAEDFEAYEARKLLLHNMSHAVLAYLGYPRGHEFIWQCIADEDVAGVCVRASADVCRALASEYGLAEASLSAFAHDLMQRFTNRALGDTVARVAADPLRKLRPEDRLIGAAVLCLKHGIESHALAEAIRAALAYDNPADPSVVRLQAMRRAEGDAAVLESLCGILPGSALAHLV